jgi:hypothetical protein
VEHSSFIKRAEAQKEIAMWIDLNLESVTTVGAVLFLVESIDTNRGTSRRSLRGTPLRTNLSHEPRLQGWCGETDNISRHAHGMVVVTKIVDGHGDGYDRACCRRASDAEMTAACEAAGYPDLV